MMTQLHDGSGLCSYILSHAIPKVAWLTSLSFGGLREWLVFQHRDREILGLNHERRLAMWKNGSLSTLPFALAEASCTEHTISYLGKVIASGVKLPI